MLRVCILEFLQVIIMMLMSARSCVAKRKQRECCGGQRPARDGESSPLHNFTEEIGTRHELEHAAGGNLVSSFTRLAQVDQDTVRVYVNRHAKEEK